MTNSLFLFAFWQVCAHVLLISIDLNVVHKLQTEKLYLTLKCCSQTTDRKTLFNNQYSAENSEESLYVYTRLASGTIL